MAEAARLDPIASFADAWRIVEPVEGWLTEAQARRLWDHARALKAPASIVEIGSFRGRSTIVLALAAAPGVRLFAIDPHEGVERDPHDLTGTRETGDLDHRAFRANLLRAGVADRVHHVRRRSQEALDAVAGPVDLLFVDGAHRYRPASTDITRWGARVAPGGTMLLHDAWNAVGVTLAQVRFLTFSRRFRYVGRVRSLAEYHCENVGGRARMGSAARQLAQLPYFARLLAIKVLIRAHLRPLARLLGQPRGDVWTY